ncbi:MAG: ribonuclease Z [Hyphomicrobiales bacterium]
MTTFKLKVLGCGSALPTMRHHPSSQVLNINEKLFLLDCGEGTQLQMRKYHIKFQKIEHVFISHLHGDHFFGLIGFVSTLHLLGRTKDLHVYGDARLENIIHTQLKASDTFLRYQVIFHPLTPKKSEVLFEDENLVIKSFPLNHRINTWGFVFREKVKLRNIKRDFLLEYDVPIDVIMDIKAGADFIDENGKLHPNHKITKTPRSPRSFAYVSDTSYYEPVIEHIKDVHLLYHEATFEASRENDARNKFHATTKQAATIAKAANAQKLLIGHYSARYVDTDFLLEEAKEVFPNTLSANEGLDIDLR